MNEERFFIWYDSSRKFPIYGPYCNRDIDAIGYKIYHTLDELLKMNISDSLKERLKNAKVGTSIKMHYLHSNGDLMVKRISDTQLEKIKEMRSINDQLQKLKEELLDLKKRSKKIMEDLIE